MRILIALLFCGSMAGATLEQSFKTPPDDCRMMVRWWWFGPSVTKPQLEREMRAMKEGGIGGFEVQPTYPMALDDPARGIRNLAFLSPEFVDALTFIAAKARELGLRYDLTLGSGWPFGGPNIPVTQAAGRLRIEKVKKGNPAPYLTEGETIIKTDAPDDTTTRYFIAGRYGMMVKRAAVGAEGFVLDHFNPIALQNHLKWAGGKIIQTKPHAIFSDSLEVFAGDWTDNLPAEFKKRRGYDLLPYLAALNEDIGPKTAAIRYDYGRTLTELVNENYLRPLHEYARKHGTLLRSQTYGVPPVSLSSQALVDLPEGEGMQWNRFSDARWASSASHLYGKPVTSSETWTWLHSPAFRATPLDMKAEADRHFLEGVTQLIGHGWPYSPEYAGEPGWRFYAAAVFNNHNPWWIVMPDIAKYFQRVSFMLRQGKPTNDIAIYLPTADVQSQFKMTRISINRGMEERKGLEEAITRVLAAGYNFDFIDDESILQLGVKHKIVVMPDVERIPLAAYRKLQGAKVIATRRKPSLAPGLREEESDSAEVRKISDSIPMTTDEQLSETLHKMLPADATLPAEIGFVHRSTGAEEVYFLANTSNKPVSATLKFRANGMQPEWWDPFSGAVSRADLNNVEFPPYGSKILVFTKRQLPAKERSPLRDLVDLSSGWQVTAGDVKIQMDTLKSLTDDARTKFFSGAAVYEKTFQVSAKPTEARIDFGPGTPLEQPESRKPGMRAWFDGPVRESAVVYVNGKRAGSVWLPPYEVDVTAQLVAGENKLKIVVGNTAINMLAGSNLPNYKLLTTRYGDRFQPQDMDNLKPVPSGILGKVKLIGR